MDVIFETLLTELSKNKDLLPIIQHTIAIFTKNIDPAILEGALNGMLRHPNTITCNIIIHIIYYYHKCVSKFKENNQSVNVFNLYNFIVDDVDKRRTELIKMQIRKH